MSVQGRGVADCTIARYYSSVMKTAFAAASNGIFLATRRGSTKCAYYAFGVFSNILPFSVPWRYGPYITYENSSLFGRATSLRRCCLLAVPDVLSAMNDRIFLRRNGYRTIANGRPSRREKTLVRQTISA